MPDAAADMLELGKGFDLPDCDRDIVERLNLRLSPPEGMFSGNHRSLPGLRRDPKSLLEFGSGAGRVMRWLRAAYPGADIAVTDIREADLLFCWDQFSATHWVSGMDIGALRAPGSYEVIWVGSVLTQLSATDTLRVLRKLLS